MSDSSHFVEHFTVLSQTRTRFYQQNAPENREWWAFADGTPVAYMRTLLFPDKRSHGERFIICDIEVRDGYRGRKFARDIIVYAELEVGEKLYSSGHYTPLGAAALMDRMPVLPYETRVGVTFDDMTFVHDWDRLVAKW